MANAKNITKIIVGEDLYYLKDKQVRDSIGANNGIATLDSSGKVPSSQLPSYVDDVIDAYYYNDTMYEDVEHTTAITPETGKIYVDLHTNESYRWSGTTYVVLSSPYVLPTASASVLGGIKVGSNLSIDNNGVLSATPTTYTAGDGIDITNNTVSIDDSVVISSNDDSEAFTPNFVPGLLTGVCTTAASTVAKEVSINGFELWNHVPVAIRFTNGISVDNATLNISSKGAKPIYYNGSALTADIVKAGNTVVMSYNGTQFDIVGGVGKLEAGFGTSKLTIDSTDSVRMKDTNGNEVYIDRSSFIGAIGGLLREILATNSTPLSITRDIGDWSGNASEVVDFKFKKNGVTSTAVSLEANKDDKELFAVSPASAAFGVIRDIGDYGSDAPVCLEFYFRTTSGNTKVGNFQVMKNSGELYWVNEVTGNSTKLA